MIEFTGTVSYTCEACDETNDISIDEFDIEWVDSDERNMGPEMTYQLSCELDCPNCSDYIHLNFYVYEYPSGILNYVADDSQGATTEHNIDLGFMTELYYMEDIPNDPSIVELMYALKKEPTLLREIDPRDFEKVIGEIFKSKGFKVEITKRSRDGGKDIIAFHNNELGLKTKYFIECKRYAEDNKVDVGLVRQLLGVKNTKDGPNKTILVTTSYFTADAKKFAEEEVHSKWDIDLVDFDTIKFWLKDYNEQDF